MAHVATHRKPAPAKVQKAASQRAKHRAKRKVRVEEWVLGVASGVVALGFVSLVLAGTLPVSSLFITTLLAVGGLLGGGVLSVLQPTKGNRVKPKASPAHASTKTPEKKPEPIRVKEEVFEVNADTPIEGIAEITRLDLIAIIEEPPVLSLRDRLKARVQRKIREKSLDALWSKALAAFNAEDRDT